MPQQDGPDWGKLAAVGFEVAVGVGLGAVVGTWIDRKFASAPWGVLIGVLLGCCAGMYLLVKDTIRANKE